MIATSGYLTVLECTKFVFGRAQPRTPMGAYSAASDPLAGLKETILLRVRGWERTE